jgi:hypothetical protein
MPYLASRVIIAKNPHFMPMMDLNSLFGALIGQFYRR